jgi:ATP-dependent RNA helicase RhlE
MTRVLENKVKKVLILAPTRELAVQIQADFFDLSKNSGLRSVLCIGGTSVRQQMNGLKTNYQFLIGTPGRVKDMYQQQYLPLGQFDALVLDEVDRMLDMGFIRDVREIVSRLPKERQSMFFSATMPREVESLCNSYSKSPVRLSTKSANYSAMVEQRVIKMSSGQRKLDVLYDLLSNQSEYKKVIIFGRTKHGVRRLARELDTRGFAVDSLHGNKTQSARLKSLEMFKKERVSILVATDVAARGIDVIDISHVINYDVPETIEDYIHRIGRTGRAGKNGIALTLVD